MRDVQSQRDGISQVRIAMARASFLGSRKPPKKPGYTKARQKAAGDEYKRALERRYGSQGAASPVRKIDPVTGKVIAIIEV